MTSEQYTRYETLLNNIATAPSLETEISAFQELLQAAVDMLAIEQIEKLFDTCSDLEDTAERWAASHEEDSPVHAWL
jgi:hypothetical protein